MILPLLLAAAAPQEAPPIIVSGPLPAAPQTAATMVLEPVAMLIATFDGDDDAMVDRSELLSGVKTSFEAVAPDGGMRYIAFADWALKYLGDRNALPSPFEVDRNQDEKVTLDEMQDHFSRLFARYDGNGDKFISRAELLTFRTAPIGADGPTQGPKPGEKPAKPPQGRRPPRR